MQASPLDSVFSARNIEKKNSSFVGLFRRTLCGSSGYKQGLLRTSAPPRGYSAGSRCLTLFPGGLPIAAAQLAHAPRALTIVNENHIKIDSIAQCYVRELIKLIEFKVSKSGSVTL